MEGEKPSTYGPRQDFQQDISIRDSCSEDSLHKDYDIFYREQDPGSSLVQMNNPDQAPKETNLISIKCRIKALQEKHERMEREKTIKLRVKEESEKVQLKLKA